MKKQHYFGTDGIRGRVGSKHMNTSFMLQLGYATGVVLAERYDDPVILLGLDTRASGAMLQSALQAGLTSAGVKVNVLGVVPTPAVAYLTQSLRASAGVVISASHNPYYDNGVKFFNSCGEKFSDEMELAIESLLEKPMDLVDPLKVAGVDYLPDASGRYSEFCKSTFPSNLNLDGLNIIVDCANGATHAVAPMIFHELGANVTQIGANPNGININQDCGATSLQALQAAIIEQSADLGIALDGDGDRLMMVDSHGEAIDGDQILCLLTIDQHQKGMLDGVVGTLMSNWGLEQALKKNGIDFKRSNVGDRYVLEMLKQNSWTLGGESSGHIVDLKHTTTGDGIITALQVLKVIRESGCSLYDLKQCMQKAPQVMINVPTNGLSFDVKYYPKLQHRIEQVELQLAGRGRVLLRPSGTEPLVRVMVEGNDSVEVKVLAKNLADFVAETLCAEA